jgi:hypothetical protein
MMRFTCREAFLPAGRLAQGCCALQLVYTLAVQCCGKTMPDRAQLCLRTRAQLCLRTRTQLCLRQALLPSTLMSSEEQELTY